MSTRIGLSVGSEHLRAMAVRGTRILWAVEGVRSPEESLADSLVELLGACPIPRWPRPAVVAAVGPAASQMRTLPGLPALDSQDQLNRALAESSLRFFLGETGTVAVSVVRRDGEERWAAAIDLATLNAIRQACRQVGLRLDAVIPSAQAIGPSFDDGCVTWIDGSVCVEAKIAGGRTRAVRRLPADPGIAGPGAMAVEVLTALGTEGWRYADAFGATRVPSSERLDVRGTVTRGATPRWRMAAALLVLTMCATTALLAPGALAARQAIRAESAMRALDSSSRVAALAAREMARFDAALEQFAHFDAGRRSSVLLLRDLGRALPAGSAIITLRVDSARGTAVVLGPRASETVASLERLPWIASPEIVGPVTRERFGERFGEREIERATVRWRLLPPTQDGGR